MSLSRLDLDEVGSASGLAAKIHELSPDLPLNFDIEALCRQLDIEEIKRIETDAFAAALVTDENKASGSILLNTNTGRRRARFSIGHELGHFLIPSHLPQRGEPLSCSRDDLKLADVRQQERSKRMEAEANRFAAELLMPAAKLRPLFASTEPDLGEVVRLAREFAVSTEAMLRRYVEVHRANVAAIGLRGNRVQAIYRPEDFPWIEVGVGQFVREESVAHSHGLDLGATSDLEECEPDTWLNEFAAKKVEVLCEQVLAQRDSYATVLLQVELAE